MKELQDLARTLLSDGTVQVVIGWEDGPTGARPVFVTSPEGADKLIFDTRCVHNLATFLSPRRSHVARLGKAAVVVKGCDARAVAMLLRESQIKREDIVLIGVRCGGVQKDPASKEPLTAATVADKCTGCDVREPHLADHVVGELPQAPPNDDARERFIEELSAMPASERWEFWQTAFARCVRCNACREVCPLCTCERCIVDKTQPRWIEPSAHPAAIMAWQITRAQHHAGRCSDCGECARVCPAGIPLDVLNREMARILQIRFDYTATDDPEAPAPLGAFRTDDGQEFIR
ncbi:MAG: Fe-S oxidoreductase [Armatimonadetes bacterium]|jgi:formate dehydrogenase subunit beta|nr:Fe-S oxidoreductase [Armatimonadota bacterium]HOC31806.1 4Fe-4S dicluster domain-containing protein [Armatimonadota bacterium]